MHTNDEKDMIILRALIRDSRSSLKDIGNECKITANAVKRRIQLLKKNKILIKPVLNINMENFGYKIMAVIGVNVDSNQEKDITNLITKYARVAGIDRTIGEYDLCIFVFAENINKIDDVKKLLTTHNGVDRVEVNIWNEIKLNYDNLSIWNKKKVESIEEH